MTTEHCCGPDHDSKFFDAVSELFKRFPQMAGKYAVTCVDHETDLMKIDFQQQIAISRIEGSRIITEFRDRSEPGTESEVCCQWCTDPNGRQYCCRAWWIPDEP